MNRCNSAISSAHNYKGAQALIIDGMGVSTLYLHHAMGRRSVVRLTFIMKHTTRTTQNLCGYSKIANYFQTGQLPGNDSFCALEAGPFGITLNGTLKQNIEDAGLSDLVH